MEKLPVVSGREVVKVLMKVGFEIVGRKGSHLRLKRKINNKVFIVIVPDHSELAKGTLTAIMRQSGLSRNEFLKSLRHKVTPS